MSSKAKIYLYKEGNEFILFNKITYQTNGYASYSKTDEYLYLKSNNVNSSGMTVSTNSTINVNNYNKIYASVKHGNCYEYTFNVHSNYTFPSFTQRNVVDAQFVEKSVSASDEYKLISIDINSLSGDKYVFFGTTGAISNFGAELYIEKVWLETKENVISINLQNASSINFSCSNLDNLITITKAEVYINNQLSKTYNDNFDNITYDIDKNLCSIGANNIKIKVTYSQGDDIYETVEEVLTHTNTVNNLSTSSSLKELIDRQEVLTNSIEVQKNNLKSILESKNVEVSDSENKLSILIDKVNNFNEVAKPLYLYNYGEFFPNFFMENTYANGGAVTLNIDNISFNCNSSVSRSGLIYISTKAIDLGKYNFLYFKYKITSFNGYGHLYVGTHSSKISNPETSGIAEYYQRIENGKVALNTEIIGKVDISTIQSGYIALRSWNGAGIGPNLEFYQIWLEP